MTGSQPLSEMTRPLSCYVCLGFSLVQLLLVLFVCNIFEFLQMSFVSCKFIMQLAFDVCSANGYFFKKFVF